ncbi:MAG: SDR family NAD(P)-dependent oxidoreductase [Candidatus Kapabacteria bacterium]|nr:SDR family NAD(P)-dependent oxidoreductase [Candidatus Kapabacteria bacterium]
MRTSVKWKNAIITGASSGIGLEFANQLASNDVNLLLIARSKDKLENIKSKLESKYNIKVEILCLDLVSPVSVNEIISYIKSIDFKVDLLINNAGAGVYGSFDKTDLSKELNTIHLNIISLTEMSKLISPLIILNGGGNILNVSSTIAFRKSPDWAVYSASKAYILSLTKSLSIEYRNSPVKFSVLCPGKTISSFDFNAGKKDDSNIKKAETGGVVSYTIRKLIIGRTMIIPGINNRIKYYAFKFLPEFLTDILISKL